MQKAFETRFLIRSQGYHYHPIDGKGRQFDFSCLLLDDRYPEVDLIVIITIKKENKIKYVHLILQNHYVK